MIDKELGMRHRRGPSSVLLAVILCCALAGAVLAQQAGHGTVPVTGAAAPGGFPTSERETDPVLERIESLRRSLGDLAKAYKKGKKDERVREDVLKGLDRVEVEIDGVRESLSKRER
jgi:hypothetical protein